MEVSRRIGFISFWKRSIYFNLVCGAAVFGVASSLAPSCGLRAQDSAFSRGANYPSTNFTNAGRQQPPVGPTAFNADSRFNPASASGPQRPSTQSGSRTGFAGTTGQSASPAPNVPGSGYRGPQVTDTHFSTAQSPKIKWIDGKYLDQALKMAAQQQRPLMLHFWNTKCAPCMALEKTVFKSPAFAQAVNSQFIAVKVNTAETPEVYRRYGVTQWPWDVFLAPDGTKLLDRGSPPNVEQYIHHLNSTANLQRNFSKFAKMTESPSKSAGQDSGLGLADKQGAFQPPKTVGSTGAAKQRESGTMLAGGIPKSSLGFQPSAVSESSQNSNPAASRPQPSFARMASSNTNSNAMNSNAMNSNAMNSNAMNSGATSDPASTTSGLALEVSPSRPAASSNTYVGTTSHQIQNQFFRGKPGATGQAKQPSLPPLGLGGKCPVALLLDEKWVTGSQQWGCIHRGKLYLFQSANYRDQFLQEPDRFAPVLAGYDVVEFRETGRLVEGKNSIGAYGGTDENRRIYRFASEENKIRFKENSSRYVEAVRVAMQNVGNRNYR